MTSKRRRPNVRLTPARSTARPIDKFIKSVQLVVLVNQLETVIQTQTFPGTIVGIRWNVVTALTTSPQFSTLIWAIVVVRDGNPTPTMSLSNGSNFYTPEQDVLTWGMHSMNMLGSGGSPAVIRDVGDTKTMRKLKQGDEIKFIAIGSTINPVTVHAVVQYFIKS